MPLLVRCPNPACGAGCSVSETFGGRPFRCPKCDKPFVVNPTLDARKEDTKKEQAASNADPFPVLPAEFGRYRILRLLGRGGMGAVYLARDSQLGRQVALKVPSFDAAKYPQRAARFVREARSAAVLQHPNICTIFDAGQIAGRPFITMAYIAGTPLDKEIDPESPMPQRRAAEIARKVALALEQAHRAGIVHRDLKPANVMMAAGGEPVVMDFGLAKQVAEVDPHEAKLTREGGVLGTPSYMAPEQVTGDAASIGPATDVYALGAMLFEMLTGRTPFTGAAGVVMGRILGSPVPPLREFRPDADPRLDAICQKALAKSPADRFPNMAELADALDQFLAAPSAPSRPTGPAPFHGPGDAVYPKIAPKRARTRGAATVPGRRRKWPIIAVVAACLLVAGMAVLWAGGALRLKTEEGTIVLEDLPPDAEVLVDGEKVAVKLKGDDLPIEVQVAPGKRTLEIRTAGYKIETREVTLTAGERKPIGIRLEPAPASNPSPAAPRNDYDDLARGRWTAVLPSPEAFERLRTEKAYAGAEPKFVAGVLQCNGGRLLFPQIQSRDAVIRAWVTRPGPKNTGNVSLILRNTGDESVGAWFNGGGLFGIGRKTKNAKWADLKTCQLAEPYDGFFELAFAAVGDRLIAYANGRKILEARDDAPLDHPADVGAGAIGLGMFRDIEVQVLDKSSEGPDFVSLFNGKDLTGWTVESGDAKQWKVQPGEIIAESIDWKTQSWLLTERDFSDYTLRMEFIVDEGASAAVAIRATPGERQPGTGDVAVPIHPMIKLTDQAKWPKEPVGTAHWVNSGERFISPQQPADLRPGWNEMEITVNGDTLRALVNGKMIIDTRLDVAPGSGLIPPGLKRPTGRVGLQAHTGAVHFRNIEIKELSPATIAPQRPPPAPVAGAADRFSAGSVWKGTRTYRKGAWAGFTVTYELHVSERNGAKFKGVKFDNGPNRNRLDVQGEVNGAVATWTESGIAFKGVIDKDTMHVEFKGPVANTTTEGDGTLSR